LPFEVAQFYYEYKQPHVRAAAHGNVVSLQESQPIGPYLDQYGTDKSFWSNRKEGWRLRANLQPIAAPSN
jgi:hypothetical protein